MGKKWGVGNINQSVHLVGSHMADQHANSANLLIFSNGVQLIPLAAFISPSHAEGREVEKKGREQRRVCYDSLLFLLNSFFPPNLSQSRGIKPWWWMRWTQGPQVAPVAMVGGSDEGWVKKKREIRKRRGNNGGEGLAYCNICSRHL